MCSRFFKLLNTVQEIENIGKNSGHVVKEGMPEHRNAGTPECRNTGTPECRNTGTPEYHFHFEGKL